MTTKQKLGEIVAELISDEQIDAVEIKKQPHFGPGDAWSFSLRGHSSSVWVMYTVTEAEFNDVKFDLGEFIVYKLKNMRDRVRQKEMQEARDKHNRRHPDHEPPNEREKIELRLVQIDYEMNTLKATKNALELLLEKPL